MKLPLQNMTNLQPILDWNFRQVFGDTCPVEQVLEPDIISALKFSQNGLYLAAGDRGGRVIIFQRKAGTGGKLPVEYEFYTEFQAHQQGFDPMRSVQITEKIVQIQWLPNCGDTLFLMTANEHLVKVWRVQNKKTTQVGNLNQNRGKKATDFSQLVIPKITRQEEQQLSSVCKRLFDNVSAYHVNSISISTEQDRFLIADDLKVSIWSVNDASEGVEVVALKAPKAEEPCEVITYAAYSPISSAQLAYGTSNGLVSLVDTRIGSFNQNSRSFLSQITSTPELPYNTFGTASSQPDIATGISSVVMSKTNLLIARDFLAVRIWDVRMEQRPLQVIPLHPQVKDYVGRFLESDAIFDRFDMAFSPDGKAFAVGSYTDRFDIFQLKGNQFNGYNIQATRQVKRRSRSILTYLGPKPSPSPNVGALSVYQDGKLNIDNLNMDPMEIRRKIQFLDWHPQENVLAAATVSNLYIYAAQ